MQQEAVGAVDVTFARRIVLRRPAIQPVIACMLSSV